MLTDDFKNFVVRTRDTLAQQGIYPEIDALLSIASSLYVEPKAVDLNTHDLRVLSALGSEKVMGFVREGKRIDAIKELRSLTSCTLREGKDALYDSRISWQFPPFDRPY